MDVYGFILFMYLSSYYFSACVTYVDEETLCVYMKNSVLPCHFTPGSDLDIRWTKTEGGLTVHSFHHGQNQDLDQYPDYSGRTSLFEEEMNRGNASLLLREVTLEDQGRYLCWANGHVTFVNMKVYAPVSEVYVDSSDGNLICQAHHIYPEPSLKWTKNPEPSAEPQPSVNRSETGLFSVYSSVPLLPNPPYKYICTVSTAHSTNSKTYEKETEPSFDYSSLLGRILLLALVSIVPAVGLCWWLRRRYYGIMAPAEFEPPTFKSLMYSKFEEMWKKKTDAPGGPIAEADAGGETVDGPNPEEEHLGSNNSEEAETEL